MHVLYSLLMIFTAFLMLALGIILARTDHPIASFIAALYYRLRVSTHPIFHTISPIDSLTNPDELIRRIHSPFDLLSLRDSLIHFLWGREKLADLMPDSIMKDWRDEEWSHIEEIRRIDKIIVRMDFGIESNIYHFINRSNNGQVMIFHAGHEGSFTIHKAAITKLLEGGCDVLAFCMPLHGINNQPVVKIEHVGYIKLISHNSMEFLELEQGHPIRYFIEPVISAINYIEKKYRYDRICMMGLSGGGWTTVLSAAIDPRIKLSFSVAGSLPLHLSIARRDFEQIDARMYRKFNYLELYLMASYGEGRKHFQINYLYDPCCFYGMSALTYKHALEKRLRTLGSGEYELIIEKEHYMHSFSEETVNKVLTELRDRH